MSKQLMSHILKVLFFRVTTLKTCCNVWLTEMCVSNVWWEESHSWRRAVLWALRMDLHWGLGQGCLMLVWYSLNGLMWLQDLEENGCCQKQKMKSNGSIYGSTETRRKLSEVVNKFCWKVLGQGQKTTSFNTSISTWVWTCRIPTPNLCPVQPLWMTWALHLEIDGESSSCCVLNLRGARLFFGHWRCSTSH